ncbi:GDYXXLXY domain-containing protein [Pontiellaceae bacterium B1224]|nr:GDYXXLXY domain-containing protein [Pontiellaceae bacterium B1224]
MKKFFLIALLIVIAIQLAVPFQMIRSQETVLRKGKLFRFTTRPIDPADPFQGRYVRLSFAADSIPCDALEIDVLERKEPIYAILSRDPDGYAFFTHWTKERPEEGDYLKTRYLYPDTEWIDDGKTLVTNGITIDLPFERFYMEESKAPQAEELARDATRISNCWANVRIYRGKAVIEDVFAEGISLKELAAKKDE